MSSIKSPLNSDDYIGTESCMDFQNSYDIVDNHKTSKPNNAGNKTKAKNSTKKEESKVFPPPIPLLARTQNLASHMPWVLKRYYTSEGRLILKEEKVKHHEYFRAHRANGRLILHLVNVSLDDYDECFEEVAPTSPHSDEEVEVDIDNVTYDYTDVITGKDRRFDEDEENVANMVVSDEISMEHGNHVVAGSSRMKCLNCNSERSSGPAFLVNYEDVRIMQFNLLTLFIILLASGSYIIRVVALAQLVAGICLPFSVAA
ncbi:hypothetical protein VNO78_30985 [Psophocarpus tetragonolobus]|uniref:FAF domain-containing protein n=1 Tax=Psophocarpus tetragonolobus TaxID=3891 RepID=A0AAN9RYE0_PSOTE